MGTFYAQYPASASAGANPSVGTAGAPAPSSATEVAGVGPDGNLHPLSTDNSGVLQVAVTSSATPQHVIVDSSALPAGASTAANQTSQISQLSTIATATAGLNLRTAGSLTPVAYDEIDLAYVPSGNGAGQIQTASFKLLGTLVKTVTITYDVSNRISTVVAS